MLPNIVNIASSGIESTKVSTLNNEPAEKFLLMEEITLIISLRQTQKYSCNNNHYLRLGDLKYIGKIK